MVMDEARGRLQTPRLRAALLGGALVLASACGQAEQALAWLQGGEPAGSSEAAALPEATSVTATPHQGRPAVPWSPVPLAAAVVSGPAPADAEELGVALGRLRQLAAVGENRQLRRWLSDRTLRRWDAALQALPPVAPRTLAAWIAGSPRRVHYSPDRALLELQQDHGPRTLTFYREPDGWKLDLLADTPFPLAAGAVPGAPPHGPAVLPDLLHAVSGLRGVGALEAVFETTAGTFVCTLEEVRAPRGVALWAALARGMVPALVPKDPGPRAWATRRWYDGTAVALAAPDVIVLPGAGGDDPRGAGLQVEDELHEDDDFGRPGALVWWADGPGANRGRVAVALSAQPAWRHVRTRLGQCRQLDVLRAMATAAGQATVTSVELRRAGR